MTKTAIVTGSNRGIGRAIAVRLAQDGMNVVLCARDEALLASTVNAIGPSALAVPIDLRLPDSAARVVDAAGEKFGSIDVVVNNAGATKRGDFEALTDEDFIDGFALKFFGAVRLTRAAWPDLKQQQGSLVNIVGAGGRTPGAMFTIGGSVNAAVLSFTKAMSEKGIQDGVQVNAINPGPVRTARLAVRLKTTTEEAFLKEERIARIGEPEDIAALVAFILSPHGRLLQGSLIDADGGQTKTL
jgi:NAD(P)-dependent dehydrogenase (short-subunit alcohol dehydrogenase family)